jgi:hypothetical protein
MRFSSIDLLVLAAAIGACFPPPVVQAVSTTRGFESVDACIFCFAANLREPRLGTILGIETDFSSPQTARAYSSRSTNMEKTTS